MICPANPDDLYFGGVSHPPKTPPQVSPLDVSANDLVFQIRRLEIEILDLLVWWKHWIFNDFENWNDNFRALK
jgi:hypothetical protein